MTLGLQFCYLKMSGNLEPQETMSSCRKVDAGAGGQVAALKRTQSPSADKDPKWSSISV